MHDSDLRRLLLGTRRVAVVGASANRARPSHDVATFLAARGYAVTAVNPGLAGQRLFGATAVATLAEAGPLDLVDVFRRSEEAGAVVDEAIRLGARAVWLQLGVVDHAAGARAGAAGVAFVQDRCPKIEWMRLGLPPDIAGR